MHAISPCMFGADISFAFHCIGDIIGPRLGFFISSVYVVALFLFSPRARRFSHSATITHETRKTVLLSSLSLLLSTPPPPMTCVA